MKIAAVLTPVCVLVGTLALGAVDAHAFRMIQNPNAIRTSIGSAVPCDDPLGFAHRTTTSIDWRLNPAGQGGLPGVQAAFQNAMSAWNGVATAGYTIRYAGTTNAGFATDGVNTALWAVGNGCTGGCLALTALVLGPGQEILEADISFNNAVTWSTGGASYDVQSIATHELGHTMGIHHTELTRKRNRPTMYAAYFGTDARTLEDDDRAALTCAHDRYPPLSGAVASVHDANVPHPVNTSSARIATRVRPGVTTLRFAVDAPGPVRLDVFDIAGRNLATLVNDVRDAGEYELAWDGSTKSGRTRPGIYFARIITARGAAHETILFEQ